jgi:hypothetical protein
MPDIMNGSTRLPTDQRIDFSENGQIAYWSKKLNAQPEKLKTAARACCSNAVDKIADYLKKNNISQRR